MGTFSITRPTVVSFLSGGRSDEDQDIPGWVGQPGSTDADLIEGLVNFTLTYLALKNTGTLAFGVTFELDETSPIFVLDGGSPISFQSLPSGFAITDFFLSFSAGTNFGPGTISFELFPTSPVDNEPASNSIFFGQSIGTISPIDFVNQQFKMTFSLGSGSGASTLIALAQFSGFSIVGNYVIQSAFTFTLTLPDAPAPGKQIRLTSDPTDPDALPIEDITEIHYTWNDGVDHEIIQTDFEIQNEFLLIWFIPFGFEDFTGDVDISATVVSTEFSGSVPLGTMAILFEDASGIYRLVRNKKTDTLYNPDRSGTTLVVKIPDPFARTGFIGG